MAIKVNIKDIQGKVDFSQSAEPTLNTEQTNTGFGFFDYFSKAINWLKAQLGYKADDSQSIDYDLSAEPAETGTKSKTANVLWQNLFNHTNFLWLKLKDLFPTTQATTHNYLPKIDNVNKKLIKSNIQDDGTTPKYGTDTIWHSGNDGSNSGLDADKLDGKHASEFIIPADLETNKLYPPTLTTSWLILNSDDEPSGITKTTSAITLEYGYKPSATVQAKWTQPSGYNTPERSDGLCGSYTIPTQLAINTNTSPAANILYNTFDPTSPTDYYKSVIVWNIYADKKGITVSGNRLIMPEGEVSANALLSVTYQLPIYYGVVTVNSMTEAIIKSLPSPIMKNCRSLSREFSPNINALDTQYWVYAYPSAWGVLTNISNADGDWSAAFTTGLIDIESSNTLLTTEYRYYITVNRGAFKDKIINFS